MSSSASVNNVDDGHVHLSINANMSIKELLYQTAALIKDAFPSVVEHSSLGDVTLGLLFVALNHNAQNTLAKHYEAPVLAKQHTSQAPSQAPLQQPIQISVHANKQFKKLKKYNPENVSFRMLKKCAEALKFANMIYYPHAYAPHLYRAAVPSANNKQNFVKLNTQQQQQQLSLLKLKASKQQFLNSGDLHSAPVDAVLVNVPPVLPVEVVKAKQEQVLAQDEQAQKQQENANNNEAATAATAANKNNNMPYQYQQLEYVFSVDSSLHYQTAHMVMLDHAQERVIIAVRGTNEMHDIFTDLSYVPLKFKCFKYYNENLASFEEIEGHAHQGFWKSATWILAQLKPALYDIYIKFPHYSIFCVGHSLGGAIASILCITLRDQFKTGLIQREAHLKKYKMELTDTELLSLRLQLPHIECVTFASPATFSYNIAQWSSSFCTAFVNGGDVVPRFSPGSAEALRIEIMTSNWQQKMKRVEDEIFERLQEYVPYVKHVNSIFETFGFTVPAALKKFENRSQAIQAQVQAPQQQQATNYEPAMPATPSTPPATPNLNDPRLKRREEMVSLYPAGELYHFIEEEVLIKQDASTPAIPSADDLEKELMAEQEATLMSSVMQYAMSHIMSKYGDAVQQHQQKLMDEAKAQAQQEQQMHDKNIENIEKIIKKKTKTVSISSQRRFKLRHVDHKTLDRIILHKNMFSDHRLVNYFEAFAFILKSEEIVNLQFAKYQKPYVPATITKL